MVAPPSEQLRSELKTVGLFAATPLVVQTVDRPVAGAGSAALVGAGQGAASTLAVGGAGCGGDPTLCALGLVLGAALAPVGALVGAGVGASKSHPEEAIADAHHAISSVVSKIEPNEDLAVAFTKLATMTYGVEIKAVSDAQTNLSASSQEGRPKYAVRLRYDSFEFHAVGRIDPDISLSATVSADIVLLADLKPVYHRAWGFQSESEPYFELAADNAAKLRTLIDASREKIASTIARDLFETKEPSPIGKPQEGAVWTIAGPAVNTGNENVPSSSTGSPLPPAN